MNEAKKARYEHVAQGIERQKELLLNSEIDGCFIRFKDGNSIKLTSAHPLGVSNPDTDLTPVDQELNSIYEGALQSITAAIVKANEDINNVINNL